MLTGCQRSGTTPFGSHGARGFPEIPGGHVTPSVHRAPTWSVRDGGRKRLSESAPFAQTLIIKKYGVTHAVPWIQKVHFGTIPGGT
jgi:hypothetical protein